ncbi:MAG: bifunctional methylenetetrahydrofolate dehydrogenase/methenyltetrahydrofolate cyclohydrolase FolD [Lentisphaeria bacterium]|nr:bifunctional methylenetetrahydrofolate dehydrogenase/methenyltetrahydrofolate cyclohydrolase FolD [Lentisphaeria bacterium]
MSGRIIDGKAIAGEINAETREAVLDLEKKGKKTALAVILVGSDPASQVYVRNKVRTCGELGIRSVRRELPDTATTEEVLSVVRELNDDPEIDGILVQSPPPPQVDEARVIEAIDPDKDVDCFSERNVGRVLIGNNAVLKPCTPWGVIELLKRSGIETAGRHAVVIGRSNIVGKPLAAMLMQKAAGANATVTVVHSGTKDIARYTRDADILIAAIGKPGFVTGDMIKPGAAVIDVGINRIFDEKLGKTRLTGDVVFEEAFAKGCAVTPVPGGVGPMTIAMLMRNTVEASKFFYGKRTEK